MGPRVVATLSVLNGTDLRRRSREHYLSALRDAGFEVVPVDAAAQAAVPEEFDALCLTGGEDVEPERYGALADPRTEPPDQQRDAFELRLVALALRRDLPILGICRGFQVLNVAYGGSLVQHVEGHREANGPIVPHLVTAAAGSKLAAISGERPYLVNARHHQAVAEADLAPGLLPTARIDGLVEAFEDPAHRWVVAVQWHPERSAEVAPEARRIFRAFADAAARQPARAR